jgi:hypothetical protein
MFDITNITYAFRANAAGTGQDLHGTLTYATGRTISVVVPAARFAEEIPEPHKDPEALDRMIQVLLIAEAMDQTQQASVSSSS